MRAIVQLEHFAVASETAVVQVYRGWGTCDGVLLKGEATVIGSNDGREESHGDTTPEASAKDRSWPRVYWTRKEFSRLREASAVGHRG